MVRRPDLHAAYSLFADAEPHRRWASEAYILSGDTFGRIAGRFNLEERSVHLYEKNLFDVVGHLGTDFDPLAAIGLTRRDDPEPRLPLRKWFALRGGPRVSDFLLGTDLSLIKTVRPGQFDTCADEYVRNQFPRPWPSPQRRSRLTAAPPRSCRTFIFAA